MWEQKLNHQLFHNSCRGKFADFIKFEYDFHVVLWYPYSLSKWRFTISSFVFDLTLWSREEKNTCREISSLAIVFGAVPVDDGTAVTTTYPTSISRSLAQGFLSSSSSSSFWGKRVKYHRFSLFLSLSLPLSDWLVIMNRESLGDRRHSKEFLSMIEGSKNTKKLSWGSTEQIDRHSIIHFAALHPTRKKKR